MGGNVDKESRGMLVGKEAPKEHVRKKGQSVKKDRWGEGGTKSENHISLV